MYGKSMKFDLRSAFSKENMVNTAGAAFAGAMAVAYVATDRPEAAAVNGFLAGVNVILASISSNPS